MRFALIGHRRDHRSMVYAQNRERARTLLCQDSSKILHKSAWPTLILPTVSPRTPIFESRNQKAKVGALERKSIFQSTSQWPFCAIDLSDATALYLSIRKLYNLQSTKLPPFPLPCQRLLRSERVFFFARHSKHHILAADM